MRFECIKNVIDFDVFYFVGMWVIWKVQLNKILSKIYKKIKERIKKRKLIIKQMVLNYQKLKLRWFVIILINIFRLIYVYSGDFGFVELNIISRVFLCRNFQLIIIFSFIVRYFYNIVNMVFCSIFFLCLSFLFYKYIIVFLVLEFSQLCYYWYICIV